MNKRNKFLGVIFLLVFCYNATAQMGINRISKEQKIYELSVIWKELSYNFANMDNCPNVNLDSLYKDYITIVQNTKNDWEYCKAIQRFLANFNNGHTSIYDIPRYLDPYIARFYLETSYKEGKIIVENIGKQYVDAMQIGDEITHINGMKALKYFEKNLVPYICATSENDKIHQAMFNRSGFAHLFEQNTKLTLKIKLQKGTKDVDIFANHIFPPNNFTKTNWVIAKNKNSNEIQVIVDTVNSFMYVHFPFCDEIFYSFFKENKDRINKYQNLIIDFSDNQGGMFYYDHSLHFLFNKDTLFDWKSSTKTNRAACKARGKAVCDDPDMQKRITASCSSCCDYYKGTFFEFMVTDNIENSVLESKRYKGNIYVITNSNTISASEGWVNALSQNKNVTVIGKKTAGALGQPLIIYLPSDLVVRINTEKAYDFQGNDISTGFLPDYEYDFSEFYKINDQQEMLNKFIEVIKGMK